MEASFRVVGFFSNFLDIQKAGKKPIALYCHNTTGAERDCFWFHGIFAEMGNAVVFFTREFFLFRAAAREKNWCFCFCFFGVCFVLFGFFLFFARQREIFLVFFSALA